MKKALVISMITILALSATACGKKEPEAVIIQAQDAGKDTTQGEYVQGDSAGKIDVDSRTGKENKKEEAKEKTIGIDADGWETVSGKPVTILGKWKCSDGSTWVLDNGYNFTKNNSLIGSYSFTYKVKDVDDTSNSLTITIWNEKTKVENQVTDEEGNITVVEEERELSKTYKYTITKYEHDDNYTTGTLYLSDENGKEVTLALEEVITYDASVETASAKKAAIEAEKRQKRREEETGIVGITADEYEEWLTQQIAAQEGAELEENNEAAEEN